MMIDDYIYQTVRRSFYQKPYPKLLNIYNNLIKQYNILK